MATLISAFLLSPGFASAATIAVSTEADSVANDGVCSLREAVNAANSDTAANGCTAGGGNDLINVPAGVYGIAGSASENSNASGDFDISSSITIRGAGSATTVSGGANDRVLDVLSGVVRIEALTITGGRAPSSTGGIEGHRGGGIRNFGQLTLQNVVMTANVAGRGGDSTNIPHQANLEAIASPGGAGGEGGAISTSGAGSSLTILDSTIVGNAAGAGGNGGRADGGNGSTDLPGRTGQGGAGGPGGAGGAIAGTSPITITNTQITGNAAGAGGSGGSGYGGIGGNGSAGSSGSVGGLGRGGAGGAGGAGGGVRAGGSLTIVSSLIAGNAAGAGGFGGAGIGGGGGNGGPGEVGGASGRGEGGTGGAGGNGGGLSAGAGASLSGVTVSQNASGAGRTGGAGEGGTGGAGGTFGGGGSYGAGGAGGAGGRGAGIAVQSGAATLLNATVTGNQSGTPGGGGLGRGGNGGGGSSSGGGGGYGQGGLGGAAGTGAAFFSTAPGHVFTHATISANATTAGGSGGSAIGGSGGSGGSAFPGSGGAGGIGGIAVDGGTLTNSILATNQGNCSTSLADGGHNIVFGDTTCPGANVDPLLGTLADRGGPVTTRNLLTGSPAIDTVPASGSGCAATDARGNGRPRGAACDIGAYEVAPPGAATGDAADVTTSSALLTGTVDPRLQTTTVHFEYGPTTAYGTSTPDAAGDGPVSAPLTGLAPLTTVHYRLVATNADGTTVGEDRTLTTLAPPSGGPVADSTAPLLTTVSLSRTRFRVGAEPTAITAALTPRGTVFRYTLSEGAAVRIAIARARPGRRSGGRCVKPTPALRNAKRCTRFVTVGALRRSGKAGANRVRFSGRIGARALRPGRYRAVLRATDAAGNRSAPVKRPFRVVRR